MKLNKNILKSFVAATALLFAVSCDTDNKNEFQQGGTSEIGAYARITDIGDTGINLLDPSISSFAANIEFVDDAGGTSINKYEIFATFRDNTILNEGDPNYSVTEEVKVGSWTSDDAAWGSNEKYATLDFSIAASDVISALGVDVANISANDQIAYRGEISLTDGRTFSLANTGKSITSELFYNDAFAWNSTFACPQSAETFVGAYTVTVEQGVTPFSSTFIADGATVDIVATGGTSRKFDFGFLSAYGFAQTFFFDLVCEETIVNAVETNVVCTTGGISWGPIKGDNGVYDPADDASFTVILNNFVKDGGCGVDKHKVTLTFTKN
ncbi:MAG: hypothetical protein OIF50_03015 [Flavobacteriaceae bacterium]|nr:hypothetical protein [Flavobacteriaceae bacterium]